MSTNAYLIAADKIAQAATVATTNAQDKALKAIAAAMANGTVEGIRLGHEIAMAELKQRLENIETMRTNAINMLNEQYPCEG